MYLFLHLYLGFNFFYFLYFFTFFGFGFCFTHTGNYKDIFLTSYLKMNYHYLAILILLILTFLYCQIRIHRKYQTDYQILQVDDPEKDILEETLSQKYPTVLTSIIMRWKGIRDLKPEMVKGQENKMNHDPKFIKLLNQYFDFYHLPMTISRNYEIKHYRPRDTHYIIKQTKFRFYIAQIYGTSRYVLFSPTQEPFLYPTDAKNVSKINYWKLENWQKALPDKSVETKRNQYLEKYPKFNKAKYIEIILHPGDMLYIPFKWWYTSQADDVNIRIMAISKSLFSW